MNQLYLGRADFYIQPDGFERYARQDGDLIRSLYTNAVLLKQAGDFERLRDGPMLAGRSGSSGTTTVAAPDPPDGRGPLAAPGGGLRCDPPTRGWWIMRVRLPG